MKKVLKLIRAGVLTGALCVGFVACNDLYDPDTGQKKGKDFYWSGNEKIWLDIDYSKMIVGFDNEQDLEAFIATTPEAVSFEMTTIALVDITDESIRQKVFAAKNVKNKLYAYTVSDNGHSIYLNGEIALWPKAGVSLEKILAKYEANIETVKELSIGVIVQLKDWRKAIATANAIHESGLVDWCAPDFYSTIIYF